MRNKAETLFIDTWSSSCGNCGQGCNPDEKSHLTNIGYGIKDGERKGCGIEWKYLSSNYYGMGEVFYKRLKEIRPDLEFYQ